MIRDYLSRLKYALKQNDTKIEFQKIRKSDDRKDYKKTNRYTIAALFPEEEPERALKRELKELDYKDYIETVKDLRFPHFSDMRVFGKVYSKKDVYIKIRVELLSERKASGGNYVFVMSFHFSEKDFTINDFPYRK